MSDLDRLQSLLSSGASCVWIVTDEEEHALRLVRDAAMTAGRPIRQWDIIRGIRDGLVTPAPAPEEGTEHPAAALYRFSERGDGSVCVMLDLIAHLSDERTLRAARDVIGAFDSQRERALPAGTLVFIDHRADLPEVLRSSATRLEFSPPDDPEIESILVATLRRENQHRPIHVNISKRSLASVVQNLRGLTRSQIERTISTAVAEDREFSPDDLPGILRKRQILEGEGLLEFVDAPTDMDQIGGLGKLKQWLKERERALTPEASKFGIDAPRGILMLGVQGAGKSLCAKAIATAWKRPLLRLDPGVLYDRYIGESERKLRSALKQAEMMAPAVLWIDEIEKAFASAASRSIDGGLSQRMFGTLLTWMQEHGSGVFLAATANDVEALPPELLRKGRFDEIFFVDLPGEEARRQIFEIHLKGGRDPKKFDGVVLAKAALGFSGAEIEQAVIAGLNRAFSAGKELGMVHLVDAIKVSPPLSVTMAERVGDLRKWAVGRCVPAE